MSDTLGTRFFWVLAIALSNALIAGINEEFRVAPRDAAISKQQTTLSKAWEMRLLFCPAEKANAFYQPVSTAEACLPKGAECFYGSDCCSGSCHDFACQ